MTLSDASGTPYLFWALGLLAMAAMLMIIVLMRRSAPPRLVADKSAKRPGDREHCEPDTP